MKQATLLLLLLLLLAQASALETFDPRSTSYMEAQYSEFGNITIMPNNDVLPYLKLNLFSFPRETEALRVYDLETAPNSALIEKDGEPAYLFEWKNLQKGTYKYELNAFVKSSQFFPKVNKKVEFPFAVPDEIKQYTVPTKKTESDDLEIKETANKIAAGETDAYRLAFKLADWVHGQVTYDIAYWQDVYSAKEVLESKRGVCDEYSNLFIALARSVGLPARYVVGSVYTNLPDVNDFQYHAWAEVWLPDVGWIPFDPTFAEYGWVDPTHITVRNSQIVEPTSITYQWQKGDVSASSLDSEIKIISKEQDLPQYVNSEIWLQEEKVAFGSYNILWMQLENAQDFYIHTAAWLAKAPAIEGENQRDVLLAPKEKKTIGWIINVPADLDGKYFYTYVLEAEALFSKNQSAKLEANPKSTAYLSKTEAEKKITESESAERLHGTPEISVEIAYPQQAFVQTPAIFSVRIKNSGTAPDERFNVCLNSKCKNLYIGINDYVEQNFTIMENTAGAYKYRIKYGGSIEEIEILFKPKTFLMLLREFLAKILNLN